MTERAIVAVALSGRIDLAAAARNLKWPELRRYAYGSVFSTENGGRLYLFNFGAIVWDGPTSLDPSVVRVIEDACNQKVIASSLDTYKLSVDPQQPSRVQVGWDLVIVPDETPEVMGPVCLLLGQSVALERYEQRADELIDESFELARHLAERGQPPRASRAQVKRIGKITCDQLELAGLFYLIDRPEETWEDAGVAALYDALFLNLELRERHRAMQEKLQSVEHVSDLVISVWQKNLSNRLEWAIVLLIVLEILLALFRVA